MKTKLGENGVLGDEQGNSAACINCRKGCHKLKAAAVVLDLGLTYLIKEAGPL